jgi:hypothetical protein
MSKFISLQLYLNGKFYPLNAIATNYERESVNEVNLSIASTHPF